MNVIRKVVAIVLTLSVSIGFSDITVFSKQKNELENSNKSHYEGDGFDVEFILDNTWDDGFNASVKITNTGEDTIENWILWMNYQGELSYSWNANMIVSDNPEYTFKNAVWNQDIEPGRSVSFGINSNEAFRGFPEAYQMLGDICKYDSKDYDIEYKTINEWNSGFTAKMNIANKSEKDIEDWVLEFDYDGNISDIWNAQILSHEKNHYLIKNMGYNSNISSEGSICFGFNGIGSGSTKPKNCDLFGYSLYNGESLEIDTDLDGIPDGYEKKLGCDYRKRDTDGDGLDDKYEIEQTDTNPSVVDTDKNGIDDNCEDLDNDGVNNGKEYTTGTNPQVIDTDKDGLNDYQEIFVHKTDSLNEDSDGDTLCDYDDVKLGFNPLMKDSDQNGVTDDKEKVYQTLDQKIICDDKDEVTSVSVSLTTNGNIENSISIDNMYGVDQMSSDVVGLVGVPVEITSSAVFDKAELSFYYDSSKLKDVNPEDLRILWYDKEHNEYKVLENSAVDTETGRVFVETTHFSTYMVVDSKAWYGAWKDNLDYRSGLGNTNYAVSFVIDVSGSMAGTRLNNAKAALEGFIEKLSDEDRANLITFTDRASVVKGFTSDKEALKNAVVGLSAYGGTNVNVGLLAAIESFKKMKTVGDKKIVLLLCDGDVNYVQKTINACKEMNISIYSVNVGSTSGKTYLDRMAKETGGEYYYCKTSDEIEPVFATIMDNTVDGVDTTDTDGDGLYDVYEIKGIRMLNGRIIKTDPYKTDSDGDGLTDYEETGIVYGKTEIKNVMLLSDPMRKDTDGDEIIDSKDRHPWKYDVENGAIIYQSYRTKTNDEMGNYAEDLKAGDKSMKDILTAMPLFYHEYIKYSVLDEEGFVDSLYDDFEDMALWFSSGKLEAVVKDMILKAKNGLEQTYSNSVLTEKMRTHSSTETFIDNIKTEVCSRLSRNNGNIRALIQNDANKENGKCIFKWAQKELNRPKFNRIPEDMLTGLTICVDDTWSSTVSIYDYDLKNNKYSGTLHFCIYDHFGVDENDVNGFYGQFAGFRAWYCLQHLIDISGAYTPLITVAEFDVPFEGETSE